jgi:hypothetical protein
LAKKPSLRKLMVDFVRAIASGAAFDKGIVMPCLARRGQSALWARKGASERGLLTWIKVELIAIKMTTGKMTVCKAVRSSGMFSRARMA